MASLSAMIQLELPHINILAKMDLVANRKDVEDFLNPEAPILLSQLNQNMPPQFKKLNKALADLDLTIVMRIGSERERGGMYYLDGSAPNGGLVVEQPDFTLLWQWRLDHLSLQKFRSVVSVDQFSMVNFVPLDLRKESSIQYVVSMIDNCIQYGEDADVKIRDFDPEEDDD